MTKHLFRCMAIALTVVTGSMTMAGSAGASDEAPTAPAVSSPAAAATDVPRTEVIENAAATADSDIEPLARTDCQSGRLCIWEHKEWGGILGMYPVYSSCYSMGVMNNQTSSFWNRTEFSVRFYDSSNCTGDYRTYKTNAYDNDLSSGGWPYSFNDKLSSFRFV